MQRKTLIAIFLVIFSVMLSSFAFYAYQLIYTPNILVNQDDRLFSIPRGSIFSEVRNRLYHGGYLSDVVSFSFLARLKNYDREVKAGMYQLEENMTNLEAIHLLRSGAETPVRLTFSNARFLHQLPSLFSKTLAFDSAEMACLLLHDTTAACYGFAPETFISMFIPNTYEVYWTTSPMSLLDRMKREYDRFWTKERLQKAKNLSMSPQEISTLASILQGETNKMDEANRIAGVYINRLRRGIPLQADPTLVYAIGDFNIKRILHKDKKFDSPYNTYKYRGLPPGPICLPSITALNAVLNYEKHKYLYFCAKEDFSGYHVFAKTLVEHNINARKFQRALNKRRIYR